MSRAAIVLLLMGCSSSAVPFRPGPVPIDDVAKACALQLSCIDPPLFPTGGACDAQVERALASSTGYPDWSAADIQRFVGCAHDAKSCGDLLGCASRLVNANDCIYGELCDNERWLHCFSGWPLGITDCGALGETCVEDPNVLGCTTNRACTGPASACGDFVLGHFITADQGSMLYTCSDTGLQSIVSCGDVIAGGGCASETSNGDVIAGCLPATSGSCTSDGTTCHGKIAEVCALGRSYSVDCGQLASHCAPNELGFDCVPDATECQPTTPDRCAGDALQLCVNGTWHTTPCPSIGWHTCGILDGAARCI